MSEIESTDEQLEAIFYLNLHGMMPFASARRLPDDELMRHVSIARRVVAESRQTFAQIDAAAYLKARDDHQNRPSGQWWEDNMQ